jgi:hypothetical protein
LALENGFMTWVVPGRLVVLAAPGIADSPLLFDMLPLFGVLADIGGRIIYRGIRSKSL